MIQIYQFVGGPTTTSPSDDDDEEESAEEAEEVDCASTNANTERTDKRMNFI